MSTITIDPYASTTAAAHDLARDVFAAVDRHGTDVEVDHIVVYFDVTAGDDTGRAEDGHPIGCVALRDADGGHVDPSRKLRHDLDEIRDSWSMREEFAGFGAAVLANLTWELNRPHGPAVEAWVEFAELAKTSPRVDISGWLSQQDPADIDDLRDDDWQMSVLLDEAADTHPDLARWMAMAHELGEDCCVRVDTIDANEWAAGMDRRLVGPDTFDAARAPFDEAADALFLRIAAIAMDHGESSWRLVSIDPSEDRRGLRISTRNSELSTVSFGLFYAHGVDAEPGTPLPASYDAIGAAIAELIDFDALEALDDRVFRHLGWIRRLAGSAPRRPSEQGTTGIPAGKRKRMRRRLMEAFGAKRATAENWLNNPASAPEAAADYIGSGLVPLPVAEGEHRIELADFERISDGADGHLSGPVEVLVAVTEDRSVTVATVG
ncbi:hypothetical protein DVS28_b0319 (plasmid) [Euzebya pacifica]|uniref:Uncharacterized protein n=1 Tax=Euzebya pacifica TaxID=1608957 RepID=A0A346Y6J2_9ACTN|nr:hypothetical protein [Euzebya pacifica]AXV10089.1 hypothetical protein DVS28_b0319 [Euzebya pacifica]